MIKRIDNLAEELFIFIYSQWLNKTSKIVDHTLQLCCSSLKCEAGLLRNNQSFSWCSCDINHYKRALNLTSFTVQGNQRDFLNELVMSLLLSYLNLLPTDALACYFPLSGWPGVRGVTRYIRSPRRGWSPGTKGSIETQSRFLFMNRFLIFLTSLLFHWLLAGWHWVAGAQGTRRCSW